MAYLLCKSHHAEFQAKCSPFMAQRPHRALLQKNSLLNWSPWSSNWSSGIKYQSGANLSVPLSRYILVPPAPAGVILMFCGLHIHQAQALIVAAAPPSHECFSARRARLGPRVQVWASRLSSTSVCSSGSGLPSRQRAAGLSAEVVESRKPFWSHTRCLEAWNTKGRSRGGHSCAPKLALGTNKEI